MLHALALTGSIGMGKSTTTKMFLERGFRIWDADEAIHRLYGWPTRDPKLDEMHKAHGLSGLAMLPDIEAAFPEVIVNGEIDRAKLRARAMDPDALDRLEAIIEPKLKPICYAFFAAMSVGKAEPPPVLLDVPRLFDTDFDKFARECAALHGRTFKTIVVTCPPEMQRERVLARPGVSEEMFEFILSRQMPDAEKRARADYVIDTSVSIEDTRRQVDHILVEMALKAA